MNYVSMIGRLTKTPDIRQTNTGKNVCTFTLAVDRRYKDADGKTTADFFSVQVWGKLAEVCARYLDKGKKIYVAGELRNRSYDAKDGTKRYVTEVIANEVEFLSPKSESAPAGSAAPVPPVDEWPDLNIDDDKLPF